jgi:hypothetical protein
MAIFNNEMGWDEMSSFSTSVIDDNLMIFDLYRVYHHHHQGGSHINMDMRHEYKNENVVISKPLVGVHKMGESEQ